MNTIIVYDMNKYMSDLNKSYATKRNLYTEFQKQQSLSGYEYSKEVFVKQKFPRFPERMRKIIVTLI